MPREQHIRGHRRVDHRGARHAARARELVQKCGIKLEAHDLPLTACTEVAVFTKYGCIIVTRCRVYKCPSQFRAWQGHKSQLATRGAKKAKHSYPCGCFGPRPAPKSVYRVSIGTHQTQRAHYCPALAALSDPPRRQRREHRQSPGEHLHRQQHSQSINQSITPESQASKTNRERRTNHPAGSTMSLLVRLLSAQHDALVGPVTEAALVLDAGACIVQIALHGSTKTKQATPSQRLCSSVRAYVDKRHRHRHRQCAA
jgi:hypothetical protein